MSGKTRMGLVPRIWAVAFCCFTKAGNCLQIFMHIFFWRGGYL